MNFGRCEFELSAGESLIPPWSLGTEREVLTWSQNSGVLGSVASPFSLPIAMLAGSPTVLLVQVGSPRLPSDTPGPHASSLGTDRLPLDPTLPRPEGPCGRTNPASHGRSRGPCPRTNPRQQSGLIRSYSDDSRKISRQDKIFWFVLSPS